VSGDAFLSTSNVVKPLAGRGCAPNPTGGAYSNSTAPDPRALELLPDASRLRVSYEKISQHCKLCIERWWQGVGVGGVEPTTKVLNATHTA